MKGSLTESELEVMTLAWLKSVGWAVKHGPHMSPDGLFPERADYREVVLTQRLRDALARLDPELLQEALEDAFRRLTPQSRHSGSPQPRLPPHARGQGRGRVPQV